MVGASARSCYIPPIDDDNNKGVIQARSLITHITSHTPSVYQSVSFQIAGKMNTQQIGWSRTQITPMSYNKRFCYKSCQFDQRWSATLIVCYSPLGYTVPLEVSMNSIHTFTSATIHVFLWQKCVAQQLTVFKNTQPPKHTEAFLSLDKRHNTAIS